MVKKQSGRTVVKRAKTRGAAPDVESPASATMMKRYGSGLRETGRDPDNVVREQAAMRWGVVHMLLNYAVGRKVSYRELGEMLTAEMPWRREVYDQSVTHRIESGFRAVRLEDVTAFVSVLRRHGVRVDPGWLAFGDDTSASPPDPALLLKASKTPV